MKETATIKKESCIKCRHYETLRGQDRGSCGAFIAVPFWMLLGMGNTVNANDGADCNLYMDIPNGVDSMPTTVINGRRKKNRGIESIYIGRPSIWGNPFASKFVAARYPWRRNDYIVTDDPVTAHRKWLEGTAWPKTLQSQRKTVLARIGELQGKVLRCWCKPQPCHGDYLAKLADELVEGNKRQDTESKSASSRATKRNSKD